ncbi:MAG: hypothetical protein FDZ72_09875 [Betaproteobacteria bacterium]|nr:MAG: hypothetical protein FDZ72_09875 [Betaproteobacteria bacterium]
MQIGSIMSHVKSVASLNASRRNEEAEAAQGAAGAVGSSQSGSTSGTSGSGSIAVDNGKDSAKVPKTAEERAAEAKAKRNALRQELDDYLSKSPAEHMRDAVLREMGLTEEDLAAMPPEKREAMEAEIADRIKERLLAKKEESPDETEQLTLARAAQAVGEYQAQADSAGNSPAGMADFQMLQAALNHRTSA